MLGSLIIYLKGMRRRMFQLSGFYYNTPRSAGVLQTLGGAVRPEVPHRPGPLGHLAARHRERGPRLGSGGLGFRGSDCA